MRRSDIQSERAEALHSFESDDIATVLPAAEFAPGPKQCSVRADPIRGKAVAFGKQQDANGGDQGKQEQFVVDPAFAYEPRTEDQYLQNHNDADALIQEAEAKLNPHVQLNLA